MSDQLQMFPPSETELRSDYCMSITHDALGTPSEGLFHVQRHGDHKHPIKSHQTGLRRRLISDEMSNIWKLLMSIFFYVTMTTSACCTQPKLFAKLCRVSSVFTVTPSSLLPPAASSGNMKVSTEPVNTIKHLFLLRQFNQSEPVSKP